MLIIGYEGQWYRMNFGTNLYLFALQTPISSFIVLTLLTEQLLSQFANNQPSVKCVNANMHPLPDMKVAREQQRLYLRFLNAKYSSEMFGLVKSLIEHEVPGTCACRARGVAHSEPDGCSQNTAAP